MTNCTWMNSNQGIVTKLLEKGSKIEVCLPRGGRLTCHNRGFEIGDEVCFSLDPSKKIITSIMHKEIADLRVALAQKPYARLDTEDEENANLETDLYSDGQEIEGLLDISRAEFGKGPEEWEDQSDYALDNKASDWDDDYSGVDSEPPGETGDNEVHLLNEWDAILGLATDYPFDD